MAPLSIKALLHAWQAPLTMDSARGHVNDTSTLEGQLVKAGGIASERALLSGGLRDRSLVAMEDHTEVQRCCSSLGCSGGSGGLLLCLHACHACGSMGVVVAACSGDAWTCCVKAVLAEQRYAETPSCSCAHAGLCGPAIWSRRVLSLSPHNLCHGAAAVGAGHAPQA